MNKKVKISIFVVLAIIIVTVIGTTFAYFAVSVNGPSNRITGRTKNFAVSLSITPIYVGTSLVPLSDASVDGAVSKNSNKCVDENNRDVCSLYRVTLSNSGETINDLIPYITTTSTTYTTNNLRAMLLNSSYTSISGILTISNTAGNKSYFESGRDYLKVNQGSTSTDYYLVIWLHETSSLQSTDQNKTFNGTITFASGEDSVYGDLSS